MTSSSISCYVSKAAPVCQSFPMASLIESLPLDILQMVLKCLSIHDHSLRAFACVSRNCHNLASPIIYHTMKIRVDSENIFFPNLQKWMQSPEGRPTRLEHVRCLTIYQAQKSQGFWTEWGLCPPDPNNTGTSDRPVLISEKPRAPNGCLELHKELESYEKISIPSSNDVWLPLADLILHLPHLSDFFFFFPTQFPECLLDRIHDSRPECRLHINLYLGKLSTASTNSYEFRLASSPCLFSIKAIHIDDHNPDQDKSSSYYQDLVALMVSGSAPNLKAVNLTYHNYYSASLDTYVPPPWKGFGENTRKSYEKSRGNLQFLRLRHHWRMTKSMLDHWNARADFTRLKTLELEAHLIPNTLRYLATEFRFPCLTTLVLGRLQREARNFDDHAEAVNQLWSCFPSLESLTLDQWYPGISIEVLAITCGPSLLELKLLNYPDKDLTNDDLEALGRHCIRLRDLTLSLRRSEGDSKEASLYKALGSIPNLQFITLDLQSVHRETWPADNVEDEDGNVWNPAFDDEFDRKVPPELVDQDEACNGAMREQLINYAIDANLVRSIFDTISAGKPGISLPLHELDITFTRAGEIGRVGCPSHFLSVLFHICHPWRITRHETHKMEHCEPNPRKHQSPPDVLESYLEAIWRRVWPEKISEDWKYDWHSFPLSKVT